MRGNTTKVPMTYTAKNSFLVSRKKILETRFVFLKQVKFSIPRVKIFFLKN